MADYETTRELLEQVCNRMEVAERDLDAAVTAGFAFALPEAELIRVEESYQRFLDESWPGDRDE